MVKHRFFVIQEFCVGARVSLPPAAARQCFRVLKLRADERIGLLDGTGLEACVLLTDVSTAGVEGVVESCDTPPVEPSDPLEFIVALPRQEKWEWIMQKGTELGVTSFQPLETARCVARISASDWPKKADRWEKIIVEAVEQSGRTRIPQLRPPITLQALTQSGIPDLAASGSHPAAGIVLHTAAGLPSLREALIQRQSNADAGTLRLLTGPEGGLEEAEVELLLSAGWTGAALGPRTLRCETAVAAACAIVMGCQ